MYTSKFKFKYDEDYDNLFIYDLLKRATYGVEWGAVDISYDQRGKLVSLSFNNATDFLTNLTNKKIVIQKLRKDFLKKYIGGIGFGARILYDETPCWVDALDPEPLFNCLAYGHPRVE